MARKSRFLFKRAKEILGTDVRDLGQYFGGGKKSSRVIKGKSKVVKKATNSSRTDKELDYVINNDPSARNRRLAREEKKRRRGY